MTRKNVWVFIAAVFVGILVFDTYLYSDSIARNSISQVIIDAASVSALVPWFVGLVMGFLGAHWFDNYKQGEK